MEIASKILIYLTAGFALLACNIWYVRAAYQSLYGGDLVVAPLKVVGGTGDAAIMGDTLARMVIASLQSLESDLRRSQSALRPDEAAHKPNAQQTGAADQTLADAPRGVTAGILSTPKTAVLNAQLFEPTNIDVKVAGVDVGGLLPRVQRWFVADRTLAFSVAWEGKTAIIAGSIDALGDRGAKPLWLSIDNATTKLIADAIALTLVHRQWAKDSSEFGELEDNEFNELVNSINGVAKANRHVTTYGVSAKADFERISTAVGPLADRMGGWTELTYFAASIAEGAENYQRALTLYRRMQKAPKPPLAADILAAKITSLEALAKVATPDDKQVALRKMQQTVGDATRVMNDLFKLSLPNPKLELLSNDVCNAYWDGKKINIPPDAQDIPDIAYHETAWPFLQKMWSFKYEAEEGALAQSYMDILTSLTKQRILKQSADKADWVIAPGAVAWITGKINEIATDRRPLRSLKAPGTAYDDPNIGKDPQPSHYSKLVVLPNSPDGDLGGVHTNSGIPNHAFYETAIRIGSDDAGRIWIESLGQFKQSLNLRAASKIIYDTAVRLYGEHSKQAEGVRAGWNAVGLPV